jgi:hypothetical protein
MHFIVNFKQTSASFTRTDKIGPLWAVDVNDHDPYSNAKNMPKGLTEVHDVGFVDVDDELEGVAHDEDEDDADQHGGHRQVPEIPTVSLLHAVQIFKKNFGPMPSCSQFKAHKQCISSQFTQQD